MDKDTIMKKLQDEIDVLHTKLDELKVTANLGKKELMDTLQPEIDKIEQQISETKEQISNLSEHSQDALEDVKEGISMAMESISEALKSAARRFTQS